MCYVIDSVKILQEPSSAYSHLKPQQIINEEKKSLNVAELITFAYQIACGMVRTLIHITDIRNLLLNSTYCIIACDGAIISKYHWF